MKEQLKAAFTSWPHCLATYVALAGAFWLLWIPFKPVRIDPPVYAVANPEQAAYHAASAISGKVWVITYTGSMKPLLQGGEFIVTHADFANVKLGQVLTYKASYYPNPLTHRAVDKDRYGWLMSGDSAPHSESWSRVTEKEYIGTVVAVYRKLDKK